MFHDPTIFIVHHLILIL